MIQEKKIAQQIREGNLEAFQEFYKSYFRRLLNYATMFINQSDVAEDIVQEAFFKLWNNREAINEDQTLVGWLYRAIRNQCINQLKQQKVHEKFIEFASNYEAIDKVYKHDFDLSLNDADDFYVWAEIKKAIESLPEKRREVYQLSKIEGHSHNEIAKELAITTKGVERHITLANRALRSKLKHLKTAIFVLALLP
ncbi:RNA polymerase sigma-70 factor [Carboxylicivirga mesophila]|uniref:RNA polymerase sigma-70 factor n=1 Tax=Carboxylicivirga mesophila TaxID=1166478 RepID=A0ABS5K7N7_9BACT|nr:RNA polymerase sigma-70 factor [Carboxylicivirga mesophila]MBS2210393.1 RNA polymerase sigma-70 factor [Carboxylicivirga mesophila]